MVMVIDNGGEREREAQGLGERESLEKWKLTWLCCHIGDRLQQVTFNQTNGHYLIIENQRSSEEFIIII